MNIRLIGIAGLSEHEVNRIFSILTDFDFIKDVGIRKLHSSWGEVLDTYDLTIEIKPDRDNVSIHIFDNSIYITDNDCRHNAIIYIDKSAYVRLEII